MDDKSPFCPHKMDGKIEKINSQIECLQKRFYEHHIELLKAMNENKVDIKSLQIKNSVSGGIAGGGMALLATLIEKFLG